MVSRLAGVRTNMGGIKSVSLGTEMWREVVTQVEPTLSSIDGMLASCQAELRNFDHGNILALRACSILREGIESGIPITYELGQVAAILSLKMDIDRSLDLTDIKVKSVRQSSYVDLEFRLLEEVLFRRDRMPNYLIDMIDNETIERVDWDRFDTVVGDYLSSYLKRLMTDKEILDQILQNDGVQVLEGTAVCSSSGCEGVDDSEINIERPVGEVEIRRDFNLIKAVDISSLLLILPQ